MPGDHVKIVSIYRALSSISNQATHVGVFTTVILVNNIQILGRSVTWLKRGDILLILGRSLSSKLYGYEVSKKVITSHSAQFGEYYQVSKCTR